MKICSICAQELDLSEFAAQATGAQGKRADCKGCHNRYNRTQTGLVKQTFSQQKRKSKLRGHTPPSYTEEMLFNWFWGQPIAYALYDAWVASDYQTALRPSIDRLDDYKPYALNNIRLVTYEDNINRYYSDAQTGLNTKSAQSVDQLDLCENYIQSFHSYSAAAKAVGGNVGAIQKVAEGAPVIRYEPDGSVRSYIPRKAYGYGWRKS